MSLDTYSVPEVNIWINLNKACENKDWYMRNGEQGEWAWWELIYWQRKKWWESIYWQKKNGWNKVIGREKICLTNLKK